jgi:hypothetical protein
MRLTKLPNGNNMVGERILDKGKALSQLASGLHRGPPEFPSDFPSGPRDILRKIEPFRAFGYLLLGIPVGYLAKWLERKHKKLFLTGAALLGGALIASSILNPCSLRDILAPQYLANLAGGAAGTLIGVHLYKE